MAEACAGWTDNAGNHHDCRFADEAPVHKFNGKTYCRFHLPMGKAGEGGKTDWDEERQAAITDAIIGRIKAESKAELKNLKKQRSQLDFQGVVVPGEFSLANETIPWLDMSYAQFHGDAWFNHAGFHGDAGFKEARFHRIAQFADAQFHEIAWFYEARFHGEGGFTEAQFYGDAEFAKARFHGRASFYHAQIHLDAVFSEARFHGEAGFNEAQFHGEAEFNEARFHGRAEFNGSADPAQPEARQFNSTSFRRAHFEAEANFSNREFRDHTDFSGCEFKEAPKFHGSILHQDTAFGGIECFPDTTSNGADRAYRTLRQAMEAHRARAEEGMFYTQEQKARRHGMSRFDPAFLMSLGYGLGSNYGFSIVRPFAYLVVGIFASALLLLCVGMVFGGPGGVGADLAAMWNDGLLFSVRQTFLPFDALRSKDEILAAYTFNPGGTGWLRAWGLVLTLFEALAALLLVLAIRWRYRR